MNKKEFVSNFAMTFMATYVAQNYQHYCSNDMQEQASTPPFEDAFQIAEEVWDNMLSYGIDEYVDKYMDK